MSPRDVSPQLTVIYWRDIPAQVKARAGRNRISAPLPDRFMVAVDAAATTAGKTKTDEYIAEWREKTRPCDGDLQAAVDGKVTAIDESYSADLVRAMVRNGGWATGDSPSESP